MLFSPEDSYFADLILFYDTLVTGLRRILAVALAAVGLFLAILFIGASPARADVASLDLETLSGVEAEEMLQNGEVTSVELVKAYLARIDALNKSGPGLNAVTQLNPLVMEEAVAADKARAEGKNLGPAMGLPILLKDIIDATPMYTSAGDWALRESFPAVDSGVAKMLRKNGVVILGKLGLSEWANSFGSQPSGFSNLTGQVLNAIDTAAGPSGSSSGSGAAAAASLATLTIGTETSGSIISPSRAQAIVGLRPTVGLVPGYGIAPILASQDTAGPMVRSVADAAMTLQSIAEVPGTDAEADAEYEGMMGPNFHTNGDIPLASFTKLPNYMSALTMSFVAGKRIGFNGTCTGSCVTPTPAQKATEEAVEALEDAGAIMVEDTALSNATIPPELAIPSGYEAHATIDEYYKHLGPNVPVKSLVEEVAVDATNPQEALKDGNNTHKTESEVEAALGGPNQKKYEEVLPGRKALYHGQIEKMLNEPSGGGGPVIAVVGSVPQGPQAGYPQVTVPMGYDPSQRRALSVSVNGGAYSEFDLIGISYVIEKSTELRQTPAEVNPAAYRCARTAVPAPFAGRGRCNPDYQSLLALLGGKPALLPFALETTSAAELEAKMNAGILTSEQLVKAELYRAALTNAQGPSLQLLRKVAPGAIAAAIASDKRRASGGSLGPLEGIPFLVDSSIDVAGLPTSAGSIALQDNLPSGDSTLVARLKAAGAVVLGDTNTTELGGAMEGSNMPQGYSSLGGQALLPSDTNKSPGGSSAGSAGAVAVGVAPLAIGMESSSEAAQMIIPSGNAGVVALKPTVGLVSRSGVLPSARSQDSPGPIAQSVADVATGLGVLAGPDPEDPATAAQPSPLPDYTAALSATALDGKKVALTAVKPVESERSQAEKNYVTEIAPLATLGATTGVVTPGTVTAASVVPYELHRDLDAYLAESPGGGANSLQQIIEYNLANPAEGLKFNQAKLLAAQAVSTADGPTKTTYEANLTTGRTEAKAVIDNILGGGYDVIMVPSDSSLVGVADRAGYPVLTVPGTFMPQNNNTGGDPIAVALIGTAFSEDDLLGYGYAYEQGVKARQTGPEYMRLLAAPGFSGAPSMTNQAMYRCVPGSAFYKPYACHPGEVVLAAETPVGGGESPPTGGGGGGEAPPPAPIGKLAPLLKKIAAGRGSIEVSVTCPAGGGECSKVTIKVLAGGRKVKIASLTISVAEGKTKTVQLGLNKAGRALLADSDHGLSAKVTVSSGGKTIKSQTVTVKKPKASGG